MSSVCGCVVGDSDVASTLAPTEWSPVSIRCLFTNATPATTALIFPFTIKSRSSLLAPAHPCGFQEMGRKTAVVVWYPCYYYCIQYTDRHPFICHYSRQRDTHLVASFSRTTWVSQHQKVKPVWISVKQEMMGWQWHQLNHMHITTPAAHTQCFTGQMLSLTPTQHCQNTEGSTRSTDLQDVPATLVPQ